jgi:amino acid adenylation domain-containing protein
MAPSIDTFVSPVPNTIPEVHNSSEVEHAKAKAIEVSVESADECSSSDGQQSVGESLEDMLRELWADVLDIDPEDIGPDSHFFELGGNSLATAELVAAATHQYPGMRISREMVFQAPCFADLAALVSLAGAGSPTAEVSSLHPFDLVDEEDVKIAAEQCGLSREQIEDVYPATALQAGLMARSLSIPGAYISQWLFHLAFPVDAESLRDWLERTIEKLPILRTSMATSAVHGFTQVINSQKVQVEIIRVASLDKWEQDFPRPAMPLGSPLSRMSVVVAEDRETPSVLWHAHHAAYDMATLELVARHLGDIASGAEMLPPPPNFNTFVSYSLEVRKSPAGKAFWTKQLLDVPSPAFPYAENLDLDSTQVVAPFRTNALYTYPLPHNDTKMNFTQANVFRAAWAFLLGCYEHSNDVLFGVTNGGRYAPVANCTGIVAPMIATSPMRVQLDYSSTVSDFLQQTSLQSVQINDWEQVGLSAIHDLGPDGQRACGFRTLVNVQTTDAARRSQFLMAPDDGPEEADAMDYGLVLELFPREGSTVPLRLSYDNSALRQDQVFEIARQLERVIAAFTAHPEATLDSIANNMGSASAGDGVGARTRKHAAVECGVLDEMVKDVSLCTAAQAASMAASLKHTSAYSSQVVFKVPEDIGRDEVVVAFEVLYQHSPILRTRLFRAPGGELMQAVIAEPVEWRECLDLQEYTTSDSELGFKLGSPLARFALVRGVQRDSRVNWVVMTAHNAVFDTAKTDQMLQFLNAAIPGSGESVPSTLLTLSPLASSVDAETLKSFWARTLQDSATPNFPEVPAAHDTLSTSHTQKSIVLQNPAPGSSSALTAWIHGAWALTLTKYQDSGDVVFGAGLSPEGEDQQSFAPTLSVVPQRINVDDLDCSISRFVQAVEAQVQSAAAHAECGIDKIKAINESCAAASRFQNLLIVHSQPEYKPASAKITFTLGEESETGKNPSQVVRDYALVLEVTASPDNGTLNVEVGYDPVVLEEVQVRRLLDHFEHVLLQTSDITSESPLRNIYHIAPSHWEELQQWNGNVPEPLMKGVHELFESRVDAQPDEPAICARDGEWTFAELDAVSEKLARWLRSMGVKSGSYVPLLFEKCGLTIVAMLGVLKAGGASVALDPSHPTKRLQGLVSGMGECIVISSGQNRELAASLGRRVVVLDVNTLRALAARPSLPRVSSEVEVIPDSTAFVLFTSGSTGMPKGILIPHKAFSSSIRGHGKVLRFTTGPGSRNFQFTAYTSDVSIGEIFTSLALGSCVCVPSDWDRKNNIAGAMRDFNVNWSFFTPSVATLLRPQEVPSLKTLVFGGETASPDNFKTWAPYLYLINSFGPAETSIWSHCIPRPVELSDFGSNIGYGVSCATWITDPDDYNKLLPIGAIGELLTEGPNVAAGYLNASEKTNATFVTNPAWMPADRKSMRIYRSGDLARFLPNGMVQFLGRRDHQVKLNGLRIELGEIEHQIRQKVPDTMVVAVDVVTPHPVGSGRILAAFIAPKDPVQPADQEDDKAATSTSAADPEAQKLLSLLASETTEAMQGALDGLEDAMIAALPRHMVPTAFVPLREMPLTASAKTDRKVLKQLASMVPAADLTRLGSTGGAARQLHAPGSVMERVLARLWGVALGRELELDVRDSFFKIGGDSLSAMRLVSLARREGVKISVEQIFKMSVLQEMARVAVVADNEHEDDEAADESPSSMVVAPYAAVGGVEAVKAGLLESAADQLGIEESDIEDIYPCTPLQEGLLAVSQDAKGSYVAQMVHELSPDTDLPRFQKAWYTLLDDWPILRTRFFPSLLDDGSVRLMQAVVKTKPRWLKPRTLNDYLKLDARDKMQTGDSMLRLAAFQDNKTQKLYFVMTIHHAVYDGWMLGLLLTALRRAYSGMPKPVTIPYNVFINRLEATDAEKSQSFWQRYVSGAPRLSWPELPTLDFRPRSNCVQTITSPLPSDRSAMSFTPTTWLRTAFAILLGAYSCTDDVVFASSVYGRASGLLSSAELVAGPTLATIPVRVGIERERLVGELMAEVQAESATMLAHEQHGMQNIRRYNMEALASVDAQSLLVVQIDEPHAAAPQNVDSEAADELKFTSTPPSDLENGFLSCALVLEATVSANGLHIVATHDDKVLQPDEVQRFLRQMTHIVGQLCSDAPDGRRVADLSLAAPEDLEEMHEWNGPVAEPKKALVHELFHEQAEDQPDAEALVSWEGMLTFQELDDLSTRLAGHLWDSCGLRPGMHVPLIFEKSMWAVVAMMAVLKVGAANVALNPAQPPETLKSLFSDVDAEFVLCSEQNLSLTQANFTKYFCVGPSIRQDGALTGENGAGGSIRPDHLAFLLFTSGSTGKPKAIMIDHYAFSSSMRGHGETLCYNKGGRNLQFTAYTSDVSIGEIFTSLTRGATVSVTSPH